MSLHFILDGYNLIKKIPKLSSKKIKDAREELIKLIKEEKLTGSRRNKVTIVFDGDFDNFTSKKELPFEIIFAQDADQKIKDIVKKLNNPKEAVIVTDDRQLVSSIRLLGAKSLGTESFLERLKKPKIIIKDLKLELSSKIKDEITEELKKIWLGREN